MAFRIKTPESAYHEQSVTLDGKSYTFIFKFNTSDLAWYLDILDVDDTVLSRSIKVMPNQNLTGRFSYSNPFDSGNLWCFRVRSEYSPVGRDNFGIDKVYELWYLTFEEEIAGGLDGTVQL